MSGALWTKTLAEFSTEELEEQYGEIFDRWTWETGSEEDRNKFEAIEKEIARRKGISARRLRANWTVHSTQQLQTEYGIDVEKELVKAIANDIAKEEDKRILRELDDEE